MGADANTKQIVCSKTAELLSAEKCQVNESFLQSEDSTMPIAKAIELVSKCSEFDSHEQELEACKEIGSKVPVLTSEIGTDPNYKFKIVWFNLIGFIILHIIGLTGALAAVLGYCKVLTSVYCE